MRAAILLLFLLVGCIGDDVFYHQDGSFQYLPVGAERVNPELTQWIAFDSVSTCAGIFSPDPNEITWYRARAIVEHPTGRRIAGLANFNHNRIWIDEAWWGDVGVNGHEILHLLHGPGIREGHPEFDRCDPMTNRR